MFTNVHVHLFSADHTPPMQLYFLMRGAIHGGARGVFEGHYNRLTIDDLKELDESLDHFGGAWPLLFELAARISKLKQGIGLLDMRRLLDMLVLVSRVSRQQLRTIFFLSEQEVEHEFLAGLLDRIVELRDSGANRPFRDALSERVNALYAAHEVGVISRGRVTHRELFEAFKKCPGSFEYYRVVALSVDFDHAFSPDDAPGLSTRPAVPFAAQVADLAAVSAEANADTDAQLEVLPFYGIDPRAFRDADHARDVLAQQVGRHRTFKGLKLYPPMGYKPSDEALWPMFTYCQDHGIPVLTHCSIGGGGVRGSQRNFAEYAHPHHWEDVLEKLANRQASGVFRVCLAHFDRLEDDPTISWSDQIMDLMERYLTHSSVEVYADIAFDIVEPATSRFRRYAENVERVRARGLERRVLFGSDWWNYLMEIDDEADFREYLTISGTLWNGRVLDEAANAFLAGVAEPIEP